MNVNGKIAIVTGASSGIGLTTAKLLTEKEVKVALVSRSTKTLEKISTDLPDSFVVTADMSKPEQVKKMVKYVKSHFGTIDILINNAGQGYDAPLEKINIDIFHNIFDLDLVGPLIAMQQVIPIMRNQGGGVIVNISSGTSLMNLPNMSAYSSLKRALASISLTAREELKAENISVSVVYPYMTETNFEKNTIKDNLKEELNGESGPPYPPDPPEFVAQKILEAIHTQEAEIFVHDWMKPKNR